MHIIIILQILGGFNSVPQLISENHLSNIKEQADIVEIISDYMPLKRAGVNFRGLCPFHNEKTPSFTVSPAKQIFHCFGCGEGGNVFTFIMKFEKVTFLESVKIIAGRLGIDWQEKVTFQNNDNSQKKALLYKANQIVADYFHFVLISSNEGKIARSYLEKRKISLNMINKFHLGYAPHNLDDLLMCLKKENIDVSILEETGIFNKEISGKKGGLYCRFKGRLMFPIFDIEGKISGMGGRILTENSDLPKYINSPESLIYHKGSMLFGLNFAKANCRNAGYLVLVEGYLDAIQPHQSGVENVVATLGTSLTESQAKLIRRITDTVIIIYDADAAGIKAADRGIDILFENGLNVKIGVLPPGMDPDKLVALQGKEALLKCINEALDLFSFKLFSADKTFNKKNFDGKIKITEQLLPLIIKVPSLIQKQEYIKKLAEFLNIEENIIKAELERKLKKELKKLKNVNNKNDMEIKNSIPSSEHMLLHILLKNPDMYNQIFSDLSVEEISDENIRKIFLFLKEHSELGAKDIFSFFQDDNISRMVSALLLEPDIFKEKTEEIIRDCKKKIKQDRKDEKIKALLIDLKKAEQLKNENQIKQILSQISKLKNA